MPVLGRTVQRSLLRPVYHLLYGSILRGDIGPLLQQQPHHRLVPVFGRLVQRRLAIIIRRVDVSPFSSSSRTTASYPFSAALCSAVCPDANSCMVFASMSAPFSSSCCTTASYPLPAARCSAVLPSGCLGAVTFYRKKVTAPYYRSQAVYGFPHRHFDENRSDGDIYRCRCLYLEVVSCRFINIIYYMIIWSLPLPWKVLLPP